MSERLTCVKVRLGGGGKSSNSGFPQHEMSPPCQSPQVKWKLALTCTKTPGGAASSATPALPQHCTDPSVRTPQLWLEPTDTWLNAPGGADPAPKALLPQHTTTASAVRTAHPWSL